ncbi:hypothetical protein BDZ90DRAFT_262505 [Jaminaea rosea]|uniref:Cyanovirin-N domain-containing protein n=1 Tax=Jaminaea rosea TaxID=1569628 RepID=A0A316UIK2_9BASI|nr:hypothetical protein BDZ90DRAFT_262505 [Jaminaea rosea]PWN25049.1 hypothetical protein BDZ90DRAFT_262505 [Jaminaea rosea]
MLVGAFFATLVPLVPLVEAYECSLSSSRTSAAPAVAHREASSSWSGVDICKVQTFPASPHDLISPLGPYSIPMSQCSNLVCRFNQCAGEGFTTRSIICDGATRVVEDNARFQDAAYGSPSGELYVCSCGGASNSDAAGQHEYRAGLGGVDLQRTSLRQRPLGG